MVSGERTGGNGMSEERMTPAGAPPSEWYYSMRLTGYAPDGVTGYTGALYSVDFVTNVIEIMADGESEPRAFPIAWVRLAGAPDTGGREET